MDLGTVYITALWPQEWDGLHMGRIRRTLQFRLTDGGLERGVIDQLAG